VRAVGFERPHQTALQDKQQIVFDDTALAATLYKMKKE
jgi:hypothetical protein